MTPEERFHYIETLLQTTGEKQAIMQEQLQATGRDIDKHNDAIRGLILSARACLDSIKEDCDRQEGYRAEWEARFKKSREEWEAWFKKSREDWEARDAATQEKLNILIETVDRIIRHRNGNA